jgi:hypothetical protein
MSLAVLKKNKALPRIANKIFSKIQSRLRLFFIILRFSPLCSKGPSFDKEFPIYLERDFPFKPSISPPPLLAGKDSNSAILPPIPEWVRQTAFYRPRNNLAAEPRCNHRAPPGSPASDTPGVTRSFVRATLDCPEFNCFPSAGLRLLGRSPAGRGRASDRCLLGSFPPGHLPPVPAALSPPGPPARLLVPPAQAQCLIGIVPARAASPSRPKCHSACVIIQSHSNAALVSES